MTIKEQDDIILNVDQNGLTYTATPGILSEILIEPENYRTRASVFYDFSFVTTNPLYMFGDMAIIIPPQIEIDMTAITFNPISTVSLTNTIVLTYDETTRKLSIDNAFESDVLEPTLVEF